MTIEDQKITEIKPEDLISNVRDMHGNGFRLVQIGCGKYDETFEINYSFEKDYKFENLRISITEGIEIPSVSDIYWGAFIYENEMHDLYGVNVKGINLDFKGNLIKTSIKNPFNVKVTKTDKKNNAESKKEEN
ncbi:NADH-quinone oxidoreductase subunit C [Methanoplanus sp. FWC-SCC4]|uniref:NADH-quinone oxidoreductase subunit C n=1 Tax=Methanochimaera problematica TaxID=2609417 RepID=A0AA97FD15_9EURY|nr:NADH-quinone oxidoreductase subunit C [Methanoplanus sp. FWC-SCC4]WOF15803.1 NADH-quinone oxidoreductase subunit C [Methanoplanus sp. FWC-SCC4]